MEKKLNEDYISWRLSTKITKTKIEMRIRLNTNI